MAQTSGFFNANLDANGNFDRVYLAEQFAEYFSGFVGNGVFQQQLDRLIVTSDGGMNIKIGTGKAFCKGFWFLNDTAVTKTLDSAHSSYRRRDAIVVRFSFADRTVSLEVKKGTASSSSPIPTLTRNADIYELMLAYVTVLPNSSSVKQGDITDTRGDSSRCGWVTGLVDQLDTTDLFLQWTSAYNDFMATMEGWFVQEKNDFDAWLNTLTQELNVNGYMKCFTHSSSPTLENANHNLSLKQPDIMKATVDGINVPVVYYDDTVAPASRPKPSDFGLVEGQACCVINKSQWTAGLLMPRFAVARNDFSYYTPSGAHIYNFEFYEWTKGFRTN